MPKFVTQAEFDDIVAALKTAFIVTPTGANPVDLKNQALKLIAARSTGQAGLGVAEQKFGDKGAVVKGYRALKRNDNIDVSAQGTPLGVITFDRPGSDPPWYTHDGGTNRQDFTRWMVKQPGGIVEAEILTSNGWVNCVTGEVNSENATQDGDSGVVKAGS